MASDQGPDRLRLRPARHRAGGRVVVVPAAHRRASAGAGVGLLRRHPRPPRRPSPAAWCARCTRPTSCSPRRTRWPARFTAHRSPVATALARQMMCRNSAAAAPARGAPGRLAGDVLHQHRRRQGGRRGVPREARPGVHRTDLGRCRRSTPGRTDGERRTTRSSSTCRRRATAATTSPGDARVRTRPGSCVRAGRPSGSPAPGSAPPCSPVRTPAASAAGGRGPRGGSGRCTPVIR